MANKKNTETYASQAKKIQKKYKNASEYDPIAKKSMLKELSKLAAQQKAHKQELGIGNAEEYGWGGALSGGISGAGTGAAIGTSLAPGIGTAIGTAAGFIGGGIAGNMQENKEDELRQKQIRMQQQSMEASRMAMIPRDATNSEMYQQPLLTYKYGGELNSYYGSNHESNPHGGIPVDSEGNLSTQTGNKPVGTVEDGEVEVGGIIFSDKLSPGDTKKNVNKGQDKGKLPQFGLGIEDPPGSLLDTVNVTATGTSKTPMLGIPDNRVVMNELDTYSNFDVAGDSPADSQGSKIGSFLNKNSDTIRDLSSFAVSTANNLRDIREAQPMPVNYQRVNPHTVDYSSEREAINQNFDTAERQGRRTAVDSSRTRGELMNRTAASNIGLERNRGQAVGQSYQREANQNAQIMGNADAQNARIQMQESMDREKEYSASQSIKRGARQNISDQFRGMLGDQSKRAAQDEAMDMMAYGNPSIEKFNIDGEDTYGVSVAPNVYKVNTGDGMKYVRNDGSEIDPDEALDEMDAHIAAKLQLDVNKDFTGSDMSQYDIIKGNTVPDITGNNSVQSGIPNQFHLEPGTMRDYYKK